MSDAARDTLSIIIGVLLTVPCVVLYFWVAVRPDIRRAMQVGRQVSNPPPAVFPFVRDVKGDLWEGLGGGMWVCYGERHLDPVKPRAPMWLPWQNVVTWYGPVTWLRPDEVRREGA